MQLQKFICTLFLLGVFLFENSYCKSGSKNVKADIDYRLPTSIAPLHYDLTISPNFESFAFTGQEQIQIICLERTNNITIHINNVTIDNYVVLDTDGITVPTTGIIFDEEREFFIIDVGTTLIQNSIYYVQINYTGLLNDMNKGFYRSNYFDYSKNETRFLVSTQMQATEARRAFPCFDEPQLKATYSIKLSRPMDYNSNSNMHLLQSTPDPEDPNRILDEFAKSPPISTYIVAFMISDFEITQNGKYRVYGRPEQISSGNGQYALSIGQSCIEWMQEFTSIPYMLDKLDQIAMPNRYFDLGGMENWGMVVYKERVLLYNDSVTTTDEKQRVASVVSHEFAHQWFGDLVTPDWFNYIWLNEGFATYFELHALNYVETTWRLLEQFTLLMLQNAMQSDSLESTRPMTSDAESPDEINALYDKIAYEKSGSVIRMMEHFLTLPVFQQGLNIHLVKSQFGNANSDDLWDSLQTAVDDQGDILPDGLTVKSIMSTWEYQAGYPVVHVERSYATGELQLTQERFLLNNATSDIDSLWSIPINYASQLNANFMDTIPTDWMTEKTLSIFTNVAAPEWVILNNQQIGYYRVNYDTNNWQLITGALVSENMNIIPPVSRAQLLDDAFNLARSGRLNYSTTLSLSSYLNQEEDYIPLYTAVNAFNHLNLILSSSSEYASFTGYVTRQLENTFIKYGLSPSPEEEHTTKLTRITVFPLLCSLGYNQCLEDSRKIFSDWQNENVEFHQDIQNIIYCNGIRQGDIQDWNFLVDQYRNAREDTQRLRMLNALGCSSNPEILNSFLDAITKENSFVNDFEILQAFQAVTNSGRLGVEVAIAYLRNSFARVLNAFTTAQAASIIQNIGTKINSEQQLTDFKQMITDNVTVDLTAPANAAIANAERNLQWIDMHEQSIIDWLNTAK